MPRSASTDRAAATLAVRARRSASARARAPTADIIWVPLRRARPFLGLERERLEAGLAQRQQGRDVPAVELDLAATDQGQGQVGERGQVARRPERALLGHDRVDPGRQHLEQALDDDRPAAAVAQGQGVGPEQEHRPDDLDRERRPNSRGVAHQQVLLEPRGIGRGDEGGGQVAEAGGHAVDHLALGDEPFDHVAGFLDAGPGVAVELDRGAVAGDGLDIGDRQVRPGQDDGVGHDVDGSRLSCPT